MMAAKGANARAAEAKPPLVSPVVAGLLSLLLPGLGHVFARQLRRGLMLLVGFATTVALAAWRFVLLAPREVDLPGIVRRSFERRAPFTGAVLAAIALLWLLGAADAHRSARSRRRPGPALFVVLAPVFVVIIRTVVAERRTREAEPRLQHEEQEGGRKSCPFHDRTPVFKRRKGIPNREREQATGVG